MFDSGHFDPLGEADAKPLPPEWLCGLAEQCAPGQANVLEDVIVQLGKTPQLSVQPLPLPPAPQQAADPSKRCAGCDVPGSVAPLPCTRRSGYCLQGHRGTFPLSRL